MLSERDYSSMLNVVRTVGEVTDPALFGYVVAEQVSQLVDSDITSLNDIDPEAGLFAFVTLPETFVVPPAAAQALAELLDEHPMIRYANETGDGSARKISDFYSTEAWHSSALYERVYAPMRVEHQMSIALPSPKPAVVGLALNRFAVDFTERDRAVLNRIRPHLAQTWRHAREHARLRMMVDTAAGALAADGSAVVLLTDPVHELTPGALTELYRFFGRPPAITPLPVRVEFWLSRERQTARESTLGEFARPLAASRAGRRVVLRYLPAAGGHSDALLLRTSAIEDGVPQLATLGLTVRETEVLNHLTTGATNAQIASTLHLATSTVKRHLDHVYGKLGVTGRVQAAAVALDIVAQHKGRPSS
jgi:DNA-binding CsgD family transcriptional regulator